MIPLTPREHRAHYDEQGNIIIPAREGEPKGSQVLWHIEEEETAEQARGVEAQSLTQLPPQEYVPEKLSALRKETWNALHDWMRTSAVGLLREGGTQYRVSVRSLALSLGEAARDFKGSARKLSTFLAQPVWVPRRRKEPKQMSRLTLFLVDTVRFGGTFATIFAALFISLNYQSFWSIVSNNLSPIERVRSAQELTATVDSALRDTLLKSPSLAVAGSNDGNLLSYLPSVGPPENRLIVPKLGLNVPLITPSYQALLEEDWAQVESDIQEALQYGAVHYPGTAKPGQAGNFFVTGHSSYYPWTTGKYKTVFARLSELEVGDEYWVYYGGDKHRFVVRGKREVRPSDVSVLDQPVNERMGTLMTCTPIGTTLRRLVLTAQEVDPQTGIALAVGEKASRPTKSVRPQALPI
ncbi:hypothetical protein COU80_00260 [Candidatus Peregrinibacteria bacterium CG10_big_fil_rev_8_21_14_0_10_55_24]|nr:MAG: hypothetical protein COU80_00260 [Candidatus Peregrinibacteria bacterium CG10_big_fil_rev_8_21_14_0_10_55_24]